MIVIVGIQWFVAVGIPPVVFGYFPYPDRLTAIVLLLIFAYCVYTGVRAWRRQWKVRFALRIVVPAGLLVVSALALGVNAWLSNSNSDGNEPHFPVPD